MQLKTSVMELLFRKIVSYAGFQENIESFFVHGICTRAAMNDKFDNLHSIRSNYSELHPWTQFFIIHWIIEIHFKK